MKTKDNNEEFILLKIHLEKLMKQNELLKKENSALKKIIENLSSKNV